MILVDSTKIHPDLGQYHSEERLFLYHIETDH